MKEQFVAAYIISLFPYELHINEYKSVLSNFYEGISIGIDRLFDEALKEHVLLIENEHVFLNSEYKKIIKDEFSSLSQPIKTHIFSLIRKKVLSLFQSSKVSDLIILYFDYIDNFTKEHNDVNFEKYNNRLIKIFQQGIVGGDNFHKVIKIFSSIYVNDRIKLYLINILYKYNQYTAVTYIFESLAANNIDWDLSIKVASSYFMTNKINIAQDMILKQKIIYKNKENIKTTLKIVELMFEFESTGEQEHPKIRRKFDKLIEKVSQDPSNENLLLKFSSSILPKDEAIILMSNSIIYENTYQVYNNMGALYLVKGYNSFLKDKDRILLNKAKHYLEFAQFICSEKGEFSPYLALNLLTLSFCQEYIKKASRRNYSKIYKKYLSIKNYADSLYFKLIVNCNCLILERLTNQNDKSQDYEKLLSEEAESTTDPKIKEKIHEFLNFNPKESTRLPLWVITETHY